jgi:ElaB/YqjD/DUF883 family membrane-anchored ribosome-binding protein
MQTTQKAYADKISKLEKTLEEHTAYSKEEILTTQENIACITKERDHLLSKLKETKNLSEKQIAEETQTLQLKHDNYVFESFFCTASVTAFAIATSCCF